MTRDILCVRPDLPLETAAILLLEHPARPLPVVNESGRVLGTDSDCDVQLETQTHRSNFGSVIDVLTPSARCVPEYTSLTRAAAVMAFEGVSCLIVLSLAGTVVGVL